MKTNRFQTSARVLVLSTGLAAIVCAIMFPSVARAATPAEVREAIRQGKEYLFANMKNNDNLEDREAPGDTFSDADVRGRQWGGLTAMATYALLASGEKPQSARIAAAIEFVEHADMKSTYTVAMRCQLYPYLEADSDRKARIQADADHLMSGCYKDGPFAGFYTYGVDHDGAPVPVGEADLSNSQLAVLGVWACEQAGADVPAEYWRRTDAAWRKARREFSDKSNATKGDSEKPDPDKVAARRSAGGWAYHPGGDPLTSPMTAAGLATLYITQDYILLSRVGLTSPCAGGLEDPELESGFNFLNAHAAELIDNYYGLYALERAGTASGRKYFGPLDWYAAGADSVVHRQQKDGSWAPNYGTAPITPLIGSKPGIATTCFALLFLSKGRAPVAMNKLQYERFGGPKGKSAVAQNVSLSKGPTIVRHTRTPWEKPDANPFDPNPVDLKPAPINADAAAFHPWNQRPRDVANFVRWAGRKLERPLNWQVVDLESTPQDLHDSQILYIGGSDQLEFSDAQADLLRQYVIEGGLILGNNDCGTPPFRDPYGGYSVTSLFSKSFVALGEKLFPGRKFRTLPPDHPIFTDQQYLASHWRLKPPQLSILGLSNGTRELMILLPDEDVSRQWNAGRLLGRPEAFELGQDIYLYTADIDNLRDRGDLYVVAPGPAKGPTKHISVGRLMVGDNPDPEPGGWTRLAAILHNDAAIDVRVLPVHLGHDELIRSRARIVHLTGTTAFKLGVDARRELREFATSGGTLVVDAAGGSTEFADSAQRELALIFNVPPNDIGRVLSQNDPLYVNPGGHAKARIETFGYRRCMRRRLAPASVSTTASTDRLSRPRLRTITEGDHPMLYYSIDDLSGGMVGEPTDGIYGYDPATATAIMRNIVLQAAGH